MCPLVQKVLGTCIREDVFIDHFSVENLRLRMCNFNKIKISIQLFYGSGISSTQYITVILVLP
jgi:hypothetical protein